MQPDKNHVAKVCARIFAAIPLLNALDRVGKAEIVDALVRNCQSDSHVDVVLRTFQETVLEWRNPIAELVQIAKATAGPEALPDGCELCETMDPATHEKRWNKHIDVFGANGEFRGIRFCSCARGEWYRAREARRAEAGR